MSIHSIFLKITNLTKPERFLDGSANKERVWASGRSVVREYYEPAREGAPHGSRHAVSASLDNAHASRLLLSISASGDGTWDVSMLDQVRNTPGLYSATFVDPSKAIKAYKTLYAAMTKYAPGAPYGARFGRPAKFAIAAAGAIVVVYAALSVFGAFLNAGSNGGAQQAAYMQQYPASYQQYPGQPIAQPANAPAPQGEESALLTAAERKLIAEKGSKVQLSNSGAELIVFSDPHCPFCKKLESELEASAKSAKITMVPVAYKSGSMELVASVLCSKDPAQAWKQVMATGKPAGQVCDAGMKKAEQNNELFAGLRFTATPTIISPKGAIVASALDAEQLGILLKN